MADVFHSFRDFMSNTSMNAVWSGLTTTLFITVTGILLGALLAAAAYLAVILRYGNRRGADIRL